MAKGTPAPNALAVRTTNTDLAVAEGVDRNDHRGTENITQGDITLPRLAVAQKTSPQIDPEKAEYIDGLKMYELFNTLTEEQYGRGPVEFIIVRHDKRAMQFDEFNNVVDFNVPLDDPRLDFTTNEKGDRVKPVATLFHDYVILLVSKTPPEAAVLSLKGTSIKVAKKLNSLIMIRTLAGGPVWAGKYTVTSTSKPSGGYTVGTYIVKPSGAASPELITAAERFYKSLEGRTVQTDREAPDVVSDDDSIPF